MADTKYIKGGDLMLFQKSGSGYTAFAYAKSHSLQLDADSLEVSSKDSGKWKQFLTTKLSYTINAEHLFTETDYNSLLEKMIAREPIEILFAIATNSNDEDGKPAEGWTAGSGWRGSAVITSISVNANDGEVASYSVSLQGSSPLAKQA
ncbi:phage tail tube protein [Bacteroides finegoldii]|uniref:phage tail tube protein n=1 Tax=Bacteroides finegoldii TaxID=338188 RepID=UPI00189CB662|nr:phage tail tube protein [Bacteroides finegoldii]